MEAGTLFLVFIAFIGLIHFAVSLAKLFGKNAKHESQSFSRTRDDWHCFFDRSELLAPPEESVSKPTPAEEPEHVFQPETDSQPLASFS